MKPCFDSDYSVHRPVDHLYAPEYLDWKDQFVKELGDDLQKANPYHDERGRFASSPGGKESDGGLKRYLEFVAQHSNASRDKFILDHGRAFPFNADSFVGGKPQECFKNAALASMSDPKLTYVEGYVSVHGVPVHHAWTVTPTGAVRDVTIKDPKGIQGYYGVPVNQRFLGESLLAKKTYGLFTYDNHRRVTSADPAKIVEKL